MAEPEHEPDHEMKGCSGLMAAILLGIIFWLIVLIILTS